MSASSGRSQSAAAAPARTPRQWVPRKAAWLQGDWIFQGVCLVAALVIPVTVLLLVFLLIRASWPSIREFGFQFFVTRQWDTVKLQFCAVPFIYGTLVTSFLAMLIAVPLSVGAATFLAEIAPGWLRRGAAFLVELLAAIPSVVYGFWGIFSLVPILQVLFRWLHVSNSSGRGIFTAGVILAIMIVPYISAITYDVCRAVPQSQRQGALALGATRWQMIWSVVLPYARPGIVGACFLALGRALGETMAVAMLIGNKNNFFPTVDLSWFGLGNSIPSIIANELDNASYEMHKSALIELGLVLFLVTVVVNILARLLLSQVGRRGGEGRGLFGWFRSRRRPVQAPASWPSADGERLIVSPSRRHFARVVNWLMTALMLACLVLTLVPLFHIFAYVTLKGFSSVNLAFFLHTPYDDPPGLGHALAGTAIMCGLATLGAVPVGLLAALYLTEYRTSRLAPVVRFIGELLGGVPSVILGVFSYILLVLPAGRDFSAWAGAFALGVMMLPIVMRASEEALKLVPSSLRNASYALGASHAQTVVRVIVPSALAPIVTGIFLAIARIAGETAPLLFTAYNSNFWPWPARSLNDRTAFLTYYIYKYSLSDNAEERRQAWAGALVLLALVMLLNVGIRTITGRRMMSATRAD